MTTSFVAVLIQLIERRGLTPHRFAVNAGLPPDYIYLILNEQRPPPVKYLERMASTLGLSGRDRYTFLALAAYANVPEHLRETLNEAETKLGLPGMTAQLRLNEDTEPAVTKPKRKTRPRHHPR